ncbi:hypothetical protein [Microbulbifer sp. GL-2]|uniref:hypothetical protein n=1 Tax=Microbulbifer sp. GL-2 TaxID=2591606 RepID=UPI00116540FA|nr:hypothetical protein [Microbulbifer sp. GL-2]BBM00893.1 hypothetical protein GL2_09670 [Microbulbifer sp. GL-2]
MYSSLVLFSLLATANPQNICTDGIALTRGVAAIAQEYPWQSNNIKDYIVRSYPRMYVVVPTKLDEKLRDGGSPTATVNKENCQVINVFLAR